MVKNGLSRLDMEANPWAREPFARVGFWRDPPSRQWLENWVYRHLRRSRLVPEDKVQELAIRLVDGERW